MRKTGCTTILIVAFLSASAFAIKPNPLISRFKPIYASFSGSPSMLVNGKFGETAWSITDSSWIAIKLEPGISKVFFIWNCTNYMWSDSIANPRDCAEGLPVPINYHMLVSGNSTNGVDGTWAAIDSVFDNVVAARGHRITLGNNYWIKMLVSKGGGKIDEIEVFDISDGAEDTWFFLGTSMTANAFKGPVQFKNFSNYVMEYVKEFNPKATPAFIRGGIGCATSNGFAADIKKLMDIAGNVNFFAIEVGTNDAWGGTTENIQSFTDNLQVLITGCKSQGIDPIIARIPATNPEKASWQISDAYLKVIDDLTKRNNLIPGPDFYDWFLKHPDELKDDGIHPSQRGGASMQRLWAEAVYKLYDPNAPRRSSASAPAGATAPARKKKKK